MIKYDTLRALHRTNEKQTRKGLDVVTLERMIELAYNKANKQGDTVDLYKVIYSYKLSRTLCEKTIEAIYEILAARLGFCSYGAEYEAAEKFIYGNGAQKMDYKQWAADLFLLAEKNYSNGGDYIIECYSQAGLESEIEMLDMKSWDEVKKFYGSRFRDMVAAEKDGADIEPQNGYGTTIELGGVYYFPAHYHMEQMQVVDFTDEMDIPDDFGGDVTFHRAAKLIYLNTANAGEHITLPVEKLERSALPVPSEEIERYHEYASGRERFALVPFVQKVKSVEGDYIELENGVWLRSLRDGRYLDDDTKDIYSETYRIEGYAPGCRACDVVICPTGRYIKNSWHYSLSYWRG